MGAQSQKRRLILFAALLLAALPLSAQQSSGQTDSLVRLLNARFLEQVETNGRMARKAVEPTFLHNGTYLSCDTALWHVDEKIINCFGHVQLVQGESVLTSEKLDYLIDDNLAQFRGAVVELRNKQENVLRTRLLDYNTQDSLAVFRGGAAMMSGDGQIIESDEGSYANARSYFSFLGNVNMFTDSVFVRTDKLDYDSKRNRADFLAPIDFWKEGNMLSAGTGWYERDADTFYFEKDVHGLGDTEESWSDSLYYYRRTNDVLMLGSVQVQDQSRKVAAMGDRLHYVDSLARVTLEERASAALWDDGREQPDTTYLGAQRFIYWTVPRCDVDSVEVALAAARREEMLGDPVAEYRRRAAEEAARKREEALRNDPVAQQAAAARQAALQAKAGKLGGVPAAGPAADTLATPADTLAILGEAKNLPDSLAATAPDTTKVGFLLSRGDVRIFRKDMQVRCDSLRYSDLDSIARLYKDPIVWNEGRRQYNADSLFVLLRNDRMERANLLSNAFIHTEEPGGYFDQIRSTDVIAYFSDSTSLRRFDALGGVTSLIYLEENDVIATVNKTESKMMMATFDENGEVDHVYNFDAPKSDAYPVVQLPAAEHRLRGFNWQPERRPKDKFDVTAMVVKDSEREAYRAHPQAEFPQTDIYFPGHMKELYEGLEAAREKRRARSAGAAPADTLSAAPADSTVVAEGLKALPDSTAVGRDSTAVVIPDGEAPTAATDTTYMSDRELKKALRIARRDARWAALDARDAQKAADKAARKEARQARRAARAAARAKRQAEIDAARLQKYIERYQKQKERHEARKQKPVPAGKRAPAVESGGELSTPPESE
jgi:lipopolysaccharide export system protein LptA